VFVGAGRGRLERNPIMNPYIADLLAQPSALRELLRNYMGSALEELHEDLKHGKFDRIIVTGMGSSLNAAYPAVIRLCRQPVPVQYVNAAELLHFMPDMIGSRSLLWMNSQSGRSAEIVHLLDHLVKRRPASILSFVNDGASAMASDSDINIDIRAGAEATVSTKTYINMLAVNLLAAVQLTDGDVEAASKELMAASDAMETYLSAWETRINELDALLGEFDQLFILGRGTSMSAVWNGSLINKEAAKSSFEGMNSADFRHGPLELVSPGFAAVIFAGSPLTSELNRNLGLEIIAHGGRVLWVGSAPDPELPTLLLPKTSDLARPLAEILPLQMLTLVMARRKGLQAGQFRYVGKVTDRE
jgi:glucosamine--fructose-6-phosphate aminotransferase (isomerizing)